MTTPATITMLAPAKINLGLEVLGRRADGYHDLVTILQTIDLADRLTFTEADELTFESSDGDLAADPSNLVLRAARLLREATGTRHGASIALEKNIPVAAGLGGGSSDAAATLVALDRLWNPGLAETARSGLARQLGADVAFFLHGGTRLATGLGDELEPLSGLDAFVVVVVVASSYPDKTRRLYRALRPEDWSDGQATLTLADDLRAGRPIHGRIFRSGFDRVARELFPELASVFSAVRRAGGIPSLCGAGPTVISLHPERDEARRVTSELRHAGFDAACYRTVPAAGPAPP
ncbi:MAG: 4-(cytidine 5'-diphospho)-2-C-methyl-D-erythritol kinase [Chloroflexota bacterium]